MAFRKKADTVLAYDPDLLIIQECEHPDKINFQQHRSVPTSVIWIGDNANKGLGVFAYHGFQLTLHQSHNPALKLIAPVIVQSATEDFLLYAIWANNPADKDGPYVTQIWKALAHYQRLIRKTKTILAGDFNSNTIWDKPRREGNHTTVVQQLAKKGIHSTYHHFFNQEQGKEKHATQYMYRKQHLAYHLDYCFVSSDYLQRLQSVEIGDPSFWLRYSDHSPVIVKLNRES